MSRAAVERLLVLAAEAETLLRRGPDMTPAERGTALAIVITMRAAVDAHLHVRTA